MSTLRITNIEAKADPSSPTVDEKIKLTNSNGDILVHIDGKTSGITTIGINTTAGNIKFDQNSNVVVTGIITATKFVGTIEPTTLTVGGDLTIPDKIVHTGDTNTALRFPAADTITAETAGSERLRITSTGNVGIGTDNPGVAGIDILANSAAVRCRESGGADARLVSGGSISYFGTYSNHDLQILTNGSNALRITSDGKVGINTNMGGAPASLYPFSVYRSTGTGYVYTETAQSGASAGFRAKAGTADFTIYTTEGTGQLAVYDNTNNAQRLKIDSSGKLKLGSNILVTPSTDADNFVIDTGDVDSGISILSATTGRIYFGDAASNDQGSIRYVHTDNSMRFETNSAERLRIDSSGCIRVGNTHSQTTSSNTKRIALGAKASIWGWTSGNINGALTLADNYYWDGSNNRAIEADNAAYLSLRSGSLRFGTTDSTPSAGGVTGLTEKLRINSNGELLIGEISSPVDEGISGATRCKIGMSFGNSTGNYIEMGGTSRTANGLSKLAVMRHGYWGGSREVGSIGFLTSSSSGGAGRGSANFVVYAGTSGNGDGGSSGDNLSIERLRVDGDGLFYVNTSAANNWSQTSNGPNNDNANGSNPSGNMCFRTSQGALVIANDADSGYSAIYINKYEWNSGDDNRWINFYLNGSGKDSITWNGSNIVYGNNSDYRIKTNIRSYTGGINLVKQIQVRQYDYIETERGTDHIGFIAHELQEVLPDAVSGEKDAMRIEEETGEEVMDIQNVDYGRVTPILTAALKEAIAKIETLEARITALEG